MSQGKTLLPWREASARSGAAMTKAETITQPRSPESAPERRIPLGTLRAASTVSSEVCADAS